jgi:phosphatidate cytidylyltransferase
MSHNLFLRCISALILIPLTFFIIYFGGWGFGLFLALTYALSCAEWYNLARRTTRVLPYTIAGILYISISFYEFAYLRLFEANGIYLTFVLLFTIWAADTGAYIFGKKFGRSHMSPTISPKKTWAGMRGAMVSSMFVFTSLIYVAPAITVIIPNSIEPEWQSLFLLIPAGAVLGFVGQSGDLLVSALKRKAEAKDSGSLIPGHGGLLDRVDSLLLTMPVFILIFRYIVDV